MNDFSVSPSLDAPVDPDVLRSKLVDLEVLGFEVAFDPHEADVLGAFREDALSDQDAMDAISDRDWEVEDV
jgi:hypothetical protein